MLKLIESKAIDPTWLVNKIGNLEDLNEVICSAIKVMSNTKSLVCAVTAVRVVPRRQGARIEGASAIPARPISHSIESVRSAQLLVRTAYGRSLLGKQGFGQTASQPTTQGVESVSRLRCSVVSIVMVRLHRVSARRPAGLPKWRTLKKPPRTSSPRRSASGALR